MRIYPKTREKFLTHYVEVPSGCWLWTGSKDAKGYGRLNGTLAHRVGYWLLVGEFPEELFVCHSCDVPLCVNPAHMFLGTNLDNMRDMFRKGRGPNVRGECNPNAKLTAEDVRRIRGDRRTATAIAADFGVGSGAIYNIRAGLTWRAIA